MTKKNTTTTTPQATLQATEKKETHRIQLDFDERSFELLTQLKTELGARSRTEVIRRALRLLNSIVQSQAELYEKEESGEMVKLRVV